MGNTDPRIRLLAEFIQRTNAANRTKTLRNKEDSETLSESQLLELKREYKILVQRNNILASALGACPYCWGSDVTCICQGYGSVGSRSPNKEAFAELILPVLDRFEFTAASAAKEERKGAADKTDKAPQDGKEV